MEIDKLNCSTENVVIRLKALHKWSNINFDELLRLSGIDVHNPELPPIDQLGYDTIIRQENQETEHLENFGKKLFQNKLPDWRPPVYTRCMDYNFNVIDRVLLALPDWGVRPAILEITARLIGRLELDLKGQFDVFKLAEGDQAAWMQSDLTPVSYKPGNHYLGMQVTFPLVQACDGSAEGKQMYQCVNFVCTEIYVDEGDAARLQLEEYGEGIMYDVQREYLKISRSIKPQPMPIKSTGIVN